MMLPADAPGWAHDLARLLQPRSHAAPLPLASFTRTDLPNAARAPGGLIYVSDATGGAIPAFSDGVHWRRCDDRAIVS
jgi:hypothetical protein